MSRRLVVLFSALLVFVAAATPVGAGSPTAATQAQATGEAPYVVLMTADPVIAYKGGIAGLPATAPVPGDKVNQSSAPVRGYMAHLERQRERALDGAGIPRSQKLADYDFAVVGFSAILTAAEAEQLAKQPGVRAVVPDERQYLDTDTSPRFLQLIAPQGAYASGYTGEGVIIGVIDSGIWPEHPSFADDGSYPAPPPEWMGGSVVCEFGNAAHNPADVPFDCQNKLIGARDMRTLYNEIVGPDQYDSARDGNGHGTHTTSTAGGNQDVPAEIFDIPRGNITGIAHRAHVAMYKGCGDSGSCFTGDLADAIDQAVADGVDVINYSIGGGPGLTGVDDLAFLFAADAGVFVATSGGNGGPDPGTIDSPANDPWITAVGANTHNRKFQGSVTLGDGSVYYGASVTQGTDELPIVDGADHGNPPCDPAVTFNPPITGAIVVCARGTVARIASSLAVYEQGGAGMVLYNVNDTQTQGSDNYYVPSVNVSFSDGQAIKGYIDAAGDEAVGVIGAGRRVRRQGSVMADFSSRGPTPAAEDLIKPDVTAPGVQILAGNTPTPDVGAPGQLFQAIMGTSMSSPHVAGLFALLKQAHPDWSAAMAKSALMTTARQRVVEQDGVTPTDPFDVGAGHVNPGKRANSPSSMFNPGLVYDAGFLDYLGFLCEAAPEVFADPEGTCAELEEDGIPVTAENLNLPSIGVAEVPGIVQVQRTVTNVTDETRTWVAKAHAPEGFQVKVAPRRVTLDPGESATVLITFTNVSAPLGEWRFGRLLWKSGPYRVKSPIAVKAIPLQAPAEVFGTGTEGSLSFEVRFGYTGEYSAGAHGLEARVDTPGAVGPDPDQEFDPTDPTGTTAHEFALNGTLFFRLALDTEDLVPPDEDIDIDLYLYNSAGEEVASSTAPGTNELIELTAPPDDTYTLYVHGWETTGLTVEYTLRSWDVPEDAGSGTLEVVSAPDAAVLGEVGTVEVAWSGLDPGTEYLGAVSHNGPDGLLGLTMVNVTTD